MPQEITIKITGEAGQGLQTIGLALCRILQRAGYYVFADQDNMSRVRGGANFLRIRVSTQVVQSPRSQSDIIVCLDAGGVRLNLPTLQEDGLLVLDKAKLKITDHEARFFDAPLGELAKQAGNSELYENSVASGLVAGLMQLEFALVEHELTAAFARKGQEVAGKNIVAARSGYELGRARQTGGRFQLPPGQAQGTWLLNGSQAVGLGAINAGCKFYTAYPMSPATGILEYMAAQAQAYNLVVEQAEDEIAAVNMAIGAAYAGVRAMTGTSGGGFCLMTEGVSLAAMTETPVVMVDAQRPGPATGFPTRTEQSDLEFALHAGHGEFARAVFTPGNHAQLFDLTQKAFNVAEKYQIPVILLTDQLMADALAISAPMPLDAVKIDRHLMPPDPPGAADETYQRYRLTASGVSPRSLPQVNAGLVYADSDEHTETGHITEDGKIRERMLEKRWHKKMAGLAAEVESPLAIGLDDCRWALLGFGSTLGVMQEAAAALAPGLLGVLHFSQVWPFPVDHCRRLLRPGVKVITVENNATGQLGRLLFRETGIKPHALILKFDGRPFELDELVARIKAEVKP